MLGIGRIKIGMRDSPHPLEIGRLEALQSVPRRRGLIELP